MSEKESKNPVRKTDEPLPEYVDIVDFRIDRERGFQIADEYERQGLTYTEAVALMSYTYYLQSQVSEYMDRISILDAGSREGAFKNVLARLESKATVVNLDHSPKRKTEVKAEIEALPFADETFDMALANWAIPDIITPDNRPTFMKDELEELYRVTKKGGIVRFVPIRLFYFGTEINLDDIEQQNYQHVLNFIRKIKEENPSVKIKVTRLYRNPYSNLPEHDNDFFESIEIIK